MATYGNIPTGYVDDGPLGALWAGQNANTQRQQNEMANLGMLMDYMTKGQAFQQADVMNPLLRDEKMGSNKTTSLANAFTESTLGNRQAISDVTGQEARARLSMPGYFNTLAQKDMDLAGITSLDLQERTATSKGAIAGKNAEYRQKVDSYLTSFIPHLKNMAPLEAATAIAESGLEPHQKSTLLKLHGIPGGLNSMLDGLSRTATSMAAERLQKQQDDAAMRRTNIQATARVEAAKRQADAAIMAGNKAAMSAIIGSTAQLHAQHTAQYDAIKDSIDNMLPEDKRKDPEGYDKMVKRRDALQKQVEDSTAVMLKLAKGIAEGSDALGGGSSKATPPKPGEMGAGGVPPPPASPAQATPAINADQKPRASIFNQTYGPLTPEATIQKNASAGDPAAIDYIMARDAAAQAKIKAAEEEAQRYRKSGGKSTAVSAPSKLDAATEADLQKYLNQ